MGGIFPGELLQAAHSRRQDSAAFQGAKLADLTADGIELYLRKRLRDPKRVRTTAAYIERGELKPATVHRNSESCGAC